MRFKQSQQKTRQISLTGFSTYPTTYRLVFPMLTNGTTPPPLYTGNKLKMYAPNVVNTKYFAQYFTIFLLLNIY